MGINLASGSIETYNDAQGGISLPSNFYSPNNPAFAVYRDAGHNNQTSGQIIFNGTAFDRTNDFDNSTSFFNAPIDGVYWFFVWSMDYLSGTQYTNDYIRLQRNSSGTNELRIYTSAAGAARADRSGGYVVKLNAGDTMRVYNQNASYYGTSYVYLYFVGCLLG